VVSTQSSSQEFEKKEPRVKARAATNLAFLHLLEGQHGPAAEYADMALKSDKYNARAFVNKVGPGAPLTLCTMFMICVVGQRDGG
jgi:hypothetical protein